MVFQLRFIRVRLELPIEIDSEELCVAIGTVLVVQEILESIDLLKSESLAILKAVFENGISLNLDVDDLVDKGS